MVYSKATEAFFEYFDCLDINDPNFIDSNGNPTILYAIHADNCLIVSELINAGANLQFIAQNIDTNIAAAPSSKRTRSGKLMPRAEPGHTLLHEAVMLMSTEILSKLLASDCQNLVNYPRSETNVTPLFIAVREGCLANVKLLLDAGADPNISAKVTKKTAKNGCIIYHEYPLFTALQQGHTYVAEALLQSATIQVNITTYDQHDTPLHLTAKTNKIELAAALLAKPDIDINMLNKNGQTPLLIAAVCGNIPIINLLIQHIAKQADPLSSPAATLPDTALIVELAANPAFNNNVSNEARYAIQFAINDYACAEVAKLRAAYLQDSPQQHPTTKINDQAKLVVTQTLLKMALPNSALSKDFITMVMQNCFTAARHKVILYAEKFFKKFNFLRSSNPNSKDKNDNPAILYAIDLNDYLTCAELIAAGATVQFVAAAPANTNTTNTETYDIIKRFNDACNNNIMPRLEPGYTLLHAAATLNSAAILKLILDNGGNRIINSRSGVAGTTALHLAVRASLKDHVTYLIINGADPNIPCKEISPSANVRKRIHDKYVLHSAIIHNRADIVQELMRSPVIDVNVVTQYEHETPLFLAAKAGLNDIVALLLTNANIDINIANKDNITPLLIAASRGYVIVIDQLLHYLAKQSKLTALTSAALVIELALNPNIDLKIRSALQYAIQEFAFTKAEHILDALRQEPAINLTDAAIRIKIQQELKQILFNMVNTKSQHSQKYLSALIQRCSQYALPETVASLPLYTTGSAKVGASYAKLSTTAANPKNSVIQNPADLFSNLMPSACQANCNAKNQEVSLGAMP